MMMLRVERKFYGFDYYWGRKWLFVSAPRYVGAKPGGVTVIFAILSPRRILWHVDGKEFQWWDIRGVIGFWRWNKAQRVHPDD